MRWFRRAGVVLGVVLSTFVLDVLTTRFLLPDTVLQEIELERYSRIFSPVYHHGLRENRTAVRARWGSSEYRFATNSLGFKDVEPRRVPLTASGRRLLIIGDSFAEGSGLSADQTFTGYIGAALAGEDTEVFNAGVVSYSPAIYYRKVKYLLEEVGFRFDHLAVFLDISDIYNEALGYELDHQDNVVERGLSARDRALDRLGGTVKNFLKRNSLIYRLFSELNRARKRSVTHHNHCLDRLGEVGDMRSLDQAVVENELIDDVSSWTFDDQVFEAWGRSGLETAARNMQRLLSTLGEHDIGMTLVVYPWPTQILKGDLDSRQVRFWQAWAEQNGVEFLNLFPGFIGSAPAMDVYARYFIPCDDHWNAAGHAYVARLFVDAYRVQRARN